MSLLESLATQVPSIVAHVVELVGIAIIALGAFVTLGTFLLRLAQGHGAEAAITTFRSALGRVILLGLEFLVAADIINTVAIRPSLTSVGVLAGIVAIRTFLSFSLETEIEGHPPWQRCKRAQARQGNAPAHGQPDTAKG